jgi:hypothetical protein
MGIWFDFGHRLRVGYRVGLGLAIFVLSWLHVNNRALSLVTGLFIKRSVLHSLFLGLFTLLSFVSVTNSLVPLEYKAQNLIPSLGNNRWEMGR